MKIITLCWILGIFLSFVIGLYAGSVLQQEHFIKGAYEVARGLDGANVEINVNLNETKMVDRMFEIINFTDDDALEQQGESK